MYKIIFISIVLFIYTNLHAQSNFTRHNDTVIDNNLNLIWQDNIESKITKKTLNDSITYCQNLSFASYDDWRLPTYEELLSIGDYEVYKPTISSVFKYSASGHYWTILYKTKPAGKHWADEENVIVKRIYFSDGYSYDNDRTGKAFVRCVKNK